MGIVRVYGTAGQGTEKGFSQLGSSPTMLGGQEGKKKEELGEGVMHRHWQPRQVVRAPNVCARSNVCLELNYHHMPCHPVPPNPPACPCPFFHCSHNTEKSETKVDIDACSCLQPCRGRGREVGEVVGTSPLSCLPRHHQPPPPA